ncbi:MAG: hypothetical protein OXN25_22875 [Candidatus Poribacteria bacterium]|nr:hypothetical protein [Candidatus Poribacteria bacterium]
MAVGDRQSAVGSVQCKKYKRFVCHNTRFSNRWKRSVPSADSH